MDRRDFFTRASTIAVAGFTANMTFDDKAEAFEQAMIDELDMEVGRPWICQPGEQFLSADDRAAASGGQPPRQRPEKRLMGDDPRLPKMPAAPTLLDFFRNRFWPASHVLQSANLALKNGHEEKVIMACLLHDISISGLIRSDHGYWSAQLVEPYVDEEISWAIRHHQALRFFPDDTVGYEYPKSYIRYFGKDYTPQPYIYEAYKRAKNHKNYMTSRLITVNDLYSFDPSIKVSVDMFADIIGRNFRDPREGLGFDGSPVAHMWRTIIWPNNFL